MVTKPTGRPRGRPKKEKPEKQRREVGRPAVPIWFDEDRYRIALHLVLTTLQKADNAPAARLVVALTECLEIEPNNDCGFVRFEQVRRPGAAATVAGRSSTIRGKARRNRTELEAYWLHHMTSAMALAFGAKNVLAKYKIIQHADAIGEKQFAIEFLIPIADASAGADLKQTLLDLPPDFFANFVSATNPKM